MFFLHVFGKVEFVISHLPVDSTVRLDGAFVPRLLYAYIGVVLLGALHIFAMPSNPLPKKTPDDGRHVTGRRAIVFVRLWLLWGHMLYYI
jgi:hypothetical protein